MGLDIILLKKISLLFILVSAAFISTSFAGRVYKSEASKEVSTINHEEIESLKAIRHDDVSEVRERLLQVNTNDYGKSGSTPTSVKPPFKLIQD
ncbi:hypothetical protein CASFOL_036180 [Castilleja foliolosa]|uniref:Uncharacterized protein n=1 Tax=Castilleja foliolosa TaxID=1961234 RepID=A0ABD3BUU6_9LAMI